MTGLHPTKPLVRETEAFQGTDRIVVELDPKSITLRLKGKADSSVSVPYDKLREWALSRLGRGHA